MRPGNGTIETTRKQRDPPRFKPGGAGIEWLGMAWGTNVDSARWRDKHLGLETWPSEHAEVETMAWRFTLRRYSENQGGRSSSKGLVSHVDAKMQRN